MSAKPGINYPDLEPGNEFWNRVRVPGSCYKSLAVAANDIQEYITQWLQPCVSVCGFSFETPGRHAVRPGVSTFR